MPKAELLNPTIAGLFAVISWGLSLPMARYIAGQIGMLAYIGTIFAATSVLGFLSHGIQKKKIFSKQLMKNWFFYLRWLFFVANMPCGMTAALIAQPEHVPFVVLLNYLWPTATILFSILFAGVRIKRLPAFAIGIVVILAALSLEILKPATLDGGLFSSGKDCVAYGLAIAAAVSWGLYSALTRRAGHETGGSAVIPAFQATLATALPISWIPGMATWHQATPFLLVCLAFWCALQFFAFRAWDLGMRKGNIVVLSLSADFIPWLSLLAMRTLLHIDIEQKTIISAILLVAGAMMVRYGTTLTTPSGAVKPVREKKRSAPG